MILVLHTTARYLAVTALTAVAATIGAVAIARHLCHITPEAGARLMGAIEEMVG